MKKIFALMVGFVLLLAGPLLAAPITVENTIAFHTQDITSTGDGTGTLLGYGGSSANRLDRCGDYVKWSQAFVFDPPADNATVKGKLTLSLRDDSTCWLDGSEWAIGWTNTGSWAGGEVDTGNYSYNVGLDNGKLIVTLASLCGDFYIDKAVLNVSYSPATAPVPEPATMLLFGVGMLGVGVFSRKRTKQR